MGYSYWFEERFKIEAKNNIKQILDDKLKEKPLYIPVNQEYKLEIERITEDAINLLVQADEIKK